MGLLQASVKPTGAGADLQTDSACPRAWLPVLPALCVNDSVQLPETVLSCEAFPC